MGLSNRLQHAWNALTGRDIVPYTPYSVGSYSYRPDRVRFTGGNERSIVTAVFNRIAMDAADIDVEHVKLDDDGRYLETLNTGLNSCLTVESNIDQAARAFFQDVYMSLFDEGCIAIVPVDTSFNPNITGSYDIHSLRTGKILEWLPDKVKVKVYNDRTGEKVDKWFLKKTVAIVENPLYAVVNEKSSTLQRLIRKLNILDSIDEQSGSGKLDLIIQLPYTIKTEARRKQAEDRRQSIEDQLSGSKYGIAYTDGTEHITQLNRPVENNLMHQIEYLTSMLFSQLGLTQEIMDGTASEEAMLNYYKRTVEPMVAAVADEMKRKFLTKTARSQRQSIMYFRDPFSLTSVTKIAEIGDTFTRNEIATSNEIRQLIGWKPSADPRANELRNKNITQKEDTAPNVPATGDKIDSSTISEEGEIQNGETV